MAMEIRLEPMDPEEFPCPAGWTVVGRAVSHALAYDPERRPHFIGEDPMRVSPEDISHDLYRAVDAAADRLWPGGWTHSMAEAFLLDRRSLSPGRFARQAPAPAVLLALAQAAASPDPVAFGALLLAMSRYSKAVEGAGPVERLDRTLEAARRAGEILHMTRLGKTIWEDRHSGGVFIKRLLRDSG
ncbi:hypothetical protein [Methylobacterium sp. SyP6R]|uniref:hypothetical protein n=1 Tax=Methylobacterium sp. SyP6R TaxID=2718876 RepID=UPI001F3B071E|nr:hypothetical protein [Methylobacterium sp. SyP6R]MCF4127920.1 hypothetical protein [Methylobacterium sp. SyP6R]